MVIQNKIVELLIWQKCHSHIENFAWSKIRPSLGKEVKEGVEYRVRENIRHITQHICKTIE